MLVSPLFCHSELFINDCKEDYKTRQDKSRMIKDFYQNEGSKAKELMRGIYYKTLLMWSQEDNWLSDEPHRERVTEAVGTGSMGEGGKKKGQVDTAIVERRRHNFLFNNSQDSGLKMAIQLK